MSAEDAPPARRCPPATSAPASCPAPQQAGRGFGRGDTLGLTVRQARALAYINAFQQLTGGICPTLQQIADAAGYCGRHRAHDGVAELQRRGLILRAPRRVRGLEVMHPEPVPVPTLNGVPLQFIPVHGAR